ncbi:hypothetical protein N6P31_16220 [Pectobacterium betavasculorum]|uniref:hypothetical protein n=1 Tax=Pectobacterium betavasculorum TaxID=55207 RepID=UPI00313CE04F
MEKIEFDIQDIERQYDSAKQNSKIGMWLSLVLIAGMFINAMTGPKDSGLFSIGFIALGGFLFMWGYNKYQASILLKKLDEWSYKRFRKSYEDAKYSDFLD